ncbi:E3 ubiquitin-protein ligase TRIM39-like [Aplochiton taeniatus]
MPAGDLPAEVLCDICHGARLRAVKSCLDCVASYCEEHLEPHKRVAIFMRHKLIDPVENQEERVCERHGRPLEMFCKTDQESVCLLCNVLYHKDHDTVTLETESEERKNKTDRDIKISNDFFTELSHLIVTAQTEHQVLLENIQQSTRTRAKELNEQLRRGIPDLQTRRAEIEQILLTEDHLHLLKRFQSLCNLPMLEDCSDIKVDSDPGVGIPIETLTELRNTINQAFQKMCEIELRKIYTYAVDVTLDPDTAHPNLTLTEDLKQTKLANLPQNLPNNPERFDSAISALGKEAFSSGRFYYEVQVKDKTHWIIGVARESINRKGLISVSSEQGYWTLRLKNGCHKALQNPSVSLSLILPPQKVGVFVDYEGGRVSFYDVDNKSHIYSYIGQAFTEKLFPFFSFNSNDGKNLAPLIISTVGVS